MITRGIEHEDKGWFVGPWDSAVTVAVGYADRRVNDPHVNREMHEICLVAHGHSTAVVDDQRIDLHAGDLLVVEPGERHTFEASSEDYLHVVVQAPFVPGDEHTG